MTDISSSPLGRKSYYSDKYDATLLYPLPRSRKKDIITVPFIEKMQAHYNNEIPMHGYDLWNMYELSWLTPDNKPCVAIGRIVYDCTSPKLIESKSLKLYLNSFNNSTFSSSNVVAETIKHDLTTALETEILVELFLLTSESARASIIKPHGECIDDIDFSMDEHNFEKRCQFLKSGISSDCTSEVFHSNLLRSNCPVTGQPDWGTVVISYNGTKIDHAGFLKYIVSYRNHHGFHEHCVENIYYDLMFHCRPKYLTVMACYTRRGGVDINPLRTNDPTNEMFKQTFHNPWFQDKNNMRNSRFIRQ